MVELFRKSGWELNPNDSIVNKILSAIERKEGYCPCQVKTEDTKCPCKEYKVNNECHCNLYTRIFPKATIFYDLTISNDNIECKYVVSDK